MIPITKDEEHQLDCGSFDYSSGNFNILIDRTCKPIYGKIDFHTDSDDWYILETMDWLNHLCGMGVSVPSNYNYEEHCCYSNNKKIMTYDTTNPAVVAQYKHALLGKPERVCIFRYKINGRKV